MRTNAETYNFFHDQMVWEIGIATGFLLTGGLITLWISCIFLLARGKQRASRQHLFFRIYITALLFLVISLEIEELLRLFCSVIFPNQIGQQQKMLNILTILTSLTPVAIGALTDGLLVWRCFVIYQRLRHSLLPVKGGCIVWIFPVCLWVLTTVTGCIGGGLLFAPDMRYSGVSKKLEATALGSNVTLNIYATIFITTLLLVHGQMVKRCLGNTASRGLGSTPQHLPLVAILLESAAINVPVTIVVAIGIGAGEDFGAIVTPSALASQALASVLIIHQVALGRAFNHRREENPGNIALIVEGPGDGPEISEYRV
ncbi:hypothetical protein P691DRAFT_778218 [Macrolepiota fuliginosa MF-IS2]|uniref:Uncharacterized protein n=1 Tax=Macrolepiota fuliginosa MF-IS2 TaxID=1400762 RepID=A0A9P6BXW9_9AGAR|nr:hypothetical protein P691DRAFT_778218 [Macrolepiota fuliginosa MF-IS2]